MSCSGELPDLPLPARAPGPRRRRGHDRSRPRGGRRARRGPAARRLAAHRTGGGSRPPPRACSLLAQDLDAFEEQTQEYVGPLKIQVAGPWTLAATVERPRGDRVLADHGARRELAQSLAAGLTRPHRRRTRRRAGRPSLVQVDEPALPAVLAASGADGLRVRPAPLGRRPEVRRLRWAGCSTRASAGATRWCTAAQPACRSTCFSACGAQGCPWTWAGSPPRGTTAWPVRWRPASRSARRRADVDAAAVTSCGRHRAGGAVPRHGRSRADRPARR